MNNKFLLENVLKNIIVIVLLYLMFNPIKNFLESLNTDSIGYQSIIVLASLLIMAFLFGNYTFTFKDSNLEHSMRFLDYLNTGLVMFGCGALLEIAFLAINLQLKANFTIIGILMLIFYITVILFDFWDLIRGMKHYN